MKITKYTHACLVVEQDDNSLIIDPGEFSTDLVIPDRVVAIIITHEHADHFDPERLAAIYSKNPESLLLADESITAKMPDYKSRSIKPSETVTIGPFKLEFFGGTHAVIHESVPAIVNVGVMVNNTLYYPGDSFTKPGQPVDTLALPIYAPWLKIAEAMDFLIDLKPRFAFPTHDAGYNDIGKSSIDNWVGRAAGIAGTEYKRIDGQAFET